MLGVEATQIQSGRPMTKAHPLEIFGGPIERNKIALEKILDLVEERGMNL